MLQSEFTLLFLYHDGNLRSQFINKKFLAWQGICSCGDGSNSFVTNGTRNTDMYIEECTQERLLPFGKQHIVLTFFMSDLESK